MSQDIDWRGHDMGRSERLIWKWWRQKRPEGWTASEHQKNPTVNVYGPRAEDLARHAAKISDWIDE